MPTKYTTAPVSLTVLPTWQVSPIQQSYLLTLILNHSVRITLSLLRYMLLVLAIDFVHFEFSHGAVLVQYRVQPRQFRVKTVCANIEHQWLWFWLGTRETYRLQRPATTIYRSRPLQLVLFSCTKPMPEPLLLNIGIHIHFQSLSVEIDIGFGILPLTPTLDFEMSQPRADLSFTQAIATCLIKTNSLQDFNVSYRWNTSW